MQTITAIELGEKLKSEEKFVLLDVREVWELDHAKIEDSRLEVMPMSRLANEGPGALPELIQKKEMPVYVICHHGSRSQQVTLWLGGQGYESIFNVQGGIEAFALQVDSSVGIY